MTVSSQYNAEKLKNKPTLLAGHFQYDFIMHWIP